jgi:hypothetical protein
MIEQLYEVFQLQGSDGEADKAADSSSDESLMQISQCALAGTTHKKSIRLQGMLNGKQVFLLIDAGSCGSYISNATVQVISSTVWCRKRTADWV